MKEQHSLGAPPSQHFHVFTNPEAHQCLIVVMIGIDIYILLRIKIFPYGSSGKESACNAGDLGLIPGLARSPEEGKGYLL